MALTSLVTWNVNSIAARLPIVLQWLETNQPDVVCLQEIKCIEAKFPTEAFRAAGYTSLIHGMPTYHGVATLVKDSLASTIGEVKRGLPGEDETAQKRVLAAKIDGVWIVNVYIPNGQAVGADKYVYKLDWLGRLHDYFQTEFDPTQPVALCGDFNVAPEPIDVYDPAVWEGKILYSEPEKTALKKVQDWGFVDSFRQFHPTDVAYSWWDYRQASFRRNLGLRIDHIWITPSLAQKCKEVTIDTEPRTWERPSDHTPVVALFEP